MDPQIAEFARDAEQLIRSAGEDTTDALCAITRTQHSFDAAAACLRDRLLQIPPPAAPPAPTLQFASLTEGYRITRRELSLVWLVAVAAACVAFAFGYSLGLPPRQRFRSRNK